VPRTQLAAHLQHIAADAHATRRQFLGAAGAAAVGLTLGATRATAAPRRPPAGQVVVVGAGLAGLTAAHRLREAGVLADVYEASDRLGGRCWSIRGVFADGQIAEHGGELIDSNHLDIKHLCQELRLPLDNLLQAEQNRTEPLYYFDGAPYTYDEAADDFNGVYQALHADVTGASYPTTHLISTEAGRALDNMSIAHWIDTRVPGGLASKFGQLLEVAYDIEYGAPCTDQSALNLLYLLGYIGQGKLRLFGRSNEKFHVRGGNDQIITELARRLNGQITTRAPLTAIRRTSAGYELTVGGRVVTADRVILALPFSILRAKVDWSQAGFSNVKSRAIRELGMGTNAKLNVGFTDRYWRTLGCNGDTYADTGYQSTWEVSRAQPGTSGILVDFLGSAGATVSGSAEAHARTFLSQLEPVLPGIAARWDGRASLDAWTTNPWTLGSYSYYRVGQYQAFGAAESEIEGAVHFCGEHTTQDFQGYLNGAVTTGERAAAEVLSAL
jgi:monoamine oxidase